MDSDLQDLFNAATTVSERATILRIQDERTARKSVGGLSDALKPLAGPLPYQQDVYLQAISIATDLVKSYVNPGDPLGQHVLDQMATRAIATARTLYPVLKMNLERIAQGLDPQ